MHHTLTAMIRTYGEQPLPPVAILRGGTMNTIANSLGILGETPKLLFELVDKHRRGARSTSSRSSSGDAAGRRQRYGFIFGNGIIYNFLHEYYATGQPSPSTAAQARSRAPPASTMVRGALAQRIYGAFTRAWSSTAIAWACEDFITVAAAVVEQIGLGFRRFIAATSGRDTFALLGIHTTRSGSCAELPRILRRQAHAPRQGDRRGRRARCCFESDEDKLEYIIDGDTYVREGTLALRIGPRLRFIRLTGDATGEAPLPDALWRCPIRA